MPDPSWKQYEERTAEVFRQLGCLVQTNFKVKGARATHVVDVYATFSRAGIDCSWIIECKLWTSRVTKEKVLALKAILEDVGADRGIIVSETGFQSGAQEAAQGTNITLVTSLEDFFATAMASTSETKLEISIDEFGKEEWKFPTQSGPHNLLWYKGKLITANWAGCSISFVDPQRKAIIRAIDLDKYEAFSHIDGKRTVRSHPPGNLVAADGRLFVGQVFSDYIIVIDLETHAIVKRLQVPGRGQGELAVSPDGKAVYFASNAVSSFFIIDTATYEIEQVNYPDGGRGCMSLLHHPTLPILYIGISRGGQVRGRRYPHANSYLAIYDLEKRRYVALSQLAEIIDGVTDDACPACISFDGIYERLYVGMFQSRRGICILNPVTGILKGELRFKPNSRNRVFPWSDPLSIALTPDLLIAVVRNNCEIVSLDRENLELKKRVDLGEARNGPRDLILSDEYVIVSYPEKNALIAIPVNDLK